VTVPEKCLSVQLWHSLSFNAFKDTESIYAMLCIQSPGSRNIRSMRETAIKMSFFSFSVAPLQCCKFAKNVPHIGLL